MNILITGGAGFIGSHLCDHLLRDGHNITVIDDLSSGKISNLTNSINNIKFYEEKIESFDFSVLKNIDSVVHLASQTSVPVSIADFKNSSSSNLLATIKILDFCKSNSSSLVYASSAAVYGNLDSADDLKPNVDLLSPYAADKFALEIYAGISNKLYGLSSIGLRFFNVYGPRQDPKSNYSGVISIFIDRILSGQGVTIFGGEQTRDFIYVDDIVNLLSMSLLKVNEKIICEQVNALTGQSISINDIANLLIDATGVETIKTYKDQFDGDPKQSNGTTQNMENFFGIDLGDMTKIKKGLNATVKFIKQ